MGTEVGVKDRSLAARAAAAVSGLGGRKGDKGMASPPTSNPGGVANLSRQQTIRLAVIDADSSFVTVLAKRTGIAGWELRQVAGAVSPEELVAMKLNALLLDPAVLEEDCWAYLEQVCTRLPDLGVVVCTDRSKVAQRVRGLRLGVDDWLTKPCHPEEAMARIEASPDLTAAATPTPSVARLRPESWQSVPTSSRLSSATAASI